MKTFLNLYTNKYLNFYFKIMLQTINKTNPVICWFSGGITSAVACKVAIDLFGKDNCNVIFIDTQNEDADTYRFKDDCQKWYGINIETITMIGKKDKAKGIEYIITSIEDVWNGHLSLNVANGAICSSILKRKCRELWQKENNYSFQVFGFESTKKEFNRAKGLNMNHPKSRPIFPLLLMGYDKKDTLNIIEEAGIVIPESYLLNFNNNNCLKTGCVQGGIGYWQHMKEVKPEVFNDMSDREHRLSNTKGEPVTMCKDQSKGGGLVFLKHNPAFPNIKDISMMKGRPPEPLKDCNGFCGVNDLERNPTEKEINYTLNL